MWDIKLKATNGKTSLVQTTVWWLPEGKGVDRESRVRRDKYMVTQEDLTLGGKHSMQYISDVS